MNRNSSTSILGYRLPRNVPRAGRSRVKLGDIRVAYLHEREARQVTYEICSQWELGTNKFGDTGLVFSTQLNSPWLRMIARMGANCSFSLQISADSYFSDLYLAH
jgi:hypothetical protein